MAMPVENDLDLAALTLDGEIIQASAEDSGDEKVIVEFTETNSSVFVEVSGYRDVSSPYSLAVTSLCNSDRDCPENTRCIAETNLCEADAVLQCGEDAFEPNNREDQAATISSLPASIEAVLCGDDKDWFSFEVNRGDIIDILALFPRGVDLDLEVLAASDGRRVTSATGDARSNPERLSLSYLEEGTYLLGVSRYVADDESDGDITYQLELAGRSGACVSNRDCTTGELPICDDGVCIETGGGKALGEVCGQDTDCDENADFCYQGGAGGQDNVCTVLCDADSACTQLGDGAYCQPISWQAGACVPACVSNDDCGTFYVCSDGRCAVDGTCRLDSDCDEGRVCRTTQNGQRFCARPADADTCGLDADLEPNGRFTTAVELPFGQRIQDLRICNDDDDYFRFVTPSEGGPWNLAFEATFRTGTDIDIYAYDALGNLLGQAITPDETTERIELTLVASGEVFLRIDQFDSNQLAETIYSVLATIEASDLRCTIEGAECEMTQPTRSVCDEASGACTYIEGAGLVGLGERCDSADDCVAEADLCPPQGVGEFPICTIACERDSDCRDVGETNCVPVRRGLRLCL